MKTLLIVFQSRTGATRQMAEAVRDGAKRAEPSVMVRLREAGDAGADDLLAADAYVFATPEMLAGIAGRMKDFFDRSYYGALDRIAGRPYAIVVCAGSDGANAVRQVERIATGWRLRGVASPIVVCTRAQTPEAILADKVLPSHELARGEALGAALAAGLDLGVY